jgi:hypothetical protein
MPVKSTLHVLDKEDDVSELKSTAGIAKLRGRFWAVWGMLFGAVACALVAMGAWSLIQGWKPEFQDVRLVAVMVAATLVTVPFYAARSKRAKLDRAG